MFLGSLSQPLPPVDPVFAAMASLNIAKMVHRTQILLTETRLALRLKLGVCWNFVGTQPHRFVSFCSIDSIDSIDRPFWGNLNFDIQNWPEPKLPKWRLRLDKDSWENIPPMVFKSFQTTNTNMLLGESFFEAGRDRPRSKEFQNFHFVHSLVHLYFSYISTLWIIMVQKATAVTTVAICCSPKTALPLKFCHSTSDSFWFLASMVFGVRSNGRRTPTEECHQEMGWLLWNPCQEPDGFFGQDGGPAACWSCCAMMCWVGKLHELQVICTTEQQHDAQRFLYKCV